MPIKAQMLHDIILNSAVLIEITIINDKQNNEPLQRGLCWRQSAETCCEWWWVGRRWATHQRLYPNLPALGWCDDALAPTHQLRWTDMQNIHSRCSFFLPKRLTVQHLTVLKVEIKKCLDAPTFFLPSPPPLPNPVSTIGGRWPSNSFHSFLLFPSFPSEVGPLKYS